MLISQALVTVTSADGRLQENLPMGLYARGYDGRIMSVSPSPSGRLVDLEDLQGTLTLPEDWLVPEQTRRSVFFNYQWHAADHFSPYCLEVDKPSTDPLLGCNVFVPNRIAPAAAGVNSKAGHSKADIRKMVKTEQRFQRFA